MSNNKFFIFISIIAVLILSGCGNNTLVPEEIDRNENELGGQGPILQGISEGAVTALYDDEKCYFPVFSLIGATCYCLEKDTYRINCMDAACSHSSMDCKAWISQDAGLLLSFGNELYRIWNIVDFSNGDGIPEYTGKIDEYSSGKTVFDNPIPDDLSKELAVEDSTRIEAVKKIDDNNLIVFGRHHNYIVDNNWNIKYQFNDNGKFFWGAIVNDKFYYVNDLYLLQEVNLESGEKRTIDLGTKVMQASYMDGVGIVYVDNFFDMYIYMPDEEKTVKIQKSCWLFSIFDGKIYTCKDEHGIILNSEGKQIGEFESGTDPYTLVKLGDRLYNFSKERLFSMNMDGSDPKSIESR